MEQQIINNKEENTQIIKPFSVDIKNIETPKNISSSVTGEDINLNPPTGTIPDVLTLEFPRFSSQIYNALISGRNRNDLRKSLMQAEYQAAQYYGREKVNEFLGRTPETIAQFNKYRDELETQQYIEIMKYDMSEEQVRDRLNTAKYSGISPSLLLLNPDKDLLAFAEKEAGIRGNFFQQLYASVKKAIGNIQQSNANSYFEEAEGVKEALKDRKAIINEGKFVVGTDWVNLSEEELFETGKQSLEQTLNTLENFANKDTEDAKYWTEGTHMRPPDNIVGATILSAIENSGFTVKSALTSLAGWSFGPMGGVFAALYNSLDESKIEAGGTFMEGLQMGKTPEEAYAAAEKVKFNNMVYLPVSNYLPDMLMFGRPFDSLIGSAFKGTGKLSQLTKSATRYGIPALTSSIIEGNEEVVQEFFTMSALNPNGKIDTDRLNEAFKMGFFDSLIYSIIGGGGKAAVSKIFHVNNQSETQKIMNDIQDLAQFRNKIKNGEIKANDVVANNSFVFIPKSVLTEETKQLLDIKDEFIEGNSEGLEEINDENTTREIKDDTDLVAIPESKWEEFVQEHSEQAQSLKNYSEERNIPITAKEYLSQKLESLSKYIKRNPEAENIKENIKEQIIKIGRNEEEAKTIADITTAVAVAIANNYEYEGGLQNLVNILWESPTNKQDKTETYNQTIVDNSGLLTEVWTRDEKKAPENEAMAERRKEYAELQKEYSISQSLIDDKSLSKKAEARIIDRQQSILKRLEEIKQERKLQEEIREELRQKYPEIYKRYNDNYKNIYAWKYADYENPETWADDSLRKEYLTLSKEYEKIETTLDNENLSDKKANKLLERENEIDARLKEIEEYVSDKSIEADKGIPLDYIYDYNWNSMDTENPETWADSPEKNEAIKIQQELNTLSDNDPHSELLMNKIDELADELWRKNPANHTTIDEFIEYLEDREMGKKGREEIETENIPIQELKTSTGVNDNPDIAANASWEENKSILEAPTIINFFKNANESSGFHELGHHILRTLVDLSTLDDISPQLIEDVETIFKNAGITHEQWDSNIDNAREKAHEYFARAFETYLAEGKAPSKQLQGTFDRIRKWLIHIYHDVVQALGIQLNDEMRDLFDRLLVTPEQVDAEMSMSDLAITENATNNAIEEITQTLEKLEQNEKEQNINNEYEVPEEVYQVQDWERENEIYNLQIEETNEIQKTIKSIKDLGGLRFKDIVHALGVELATDLKKKFRTLFVKTSDVPKLPIDILQLNLESMGYQFHDTNDLINWLVNTKIETPQKPAPTIEVSERSIAALINELGGTEQVKGYIGERKNFINKLINEIEKELIFAEDKYYKDKSKLSNTDIVILEHDFNELVKEREFINNFLHETGKNTGENDMPLWLQRVGNEDNSVSKLSNAIAEMGYEIAKKYLTLGYKTGVNEERKAKLARIKQLREQLNERHKQHQEERLNKLQEYYENKFEKLEIKERKKYDKLNERMNNRLTKLNKRILDLKRRQQQLKEKQAYRKKLRQERKNMMKELDRMKESKNIFWDNLQEINNILSQYDKKQIREMSIFDLYDVYNQAKDIYNEGREKLATIKTLENQRIENIRQQLRDTMPSFYSSQNAPAAIRGRKDLQKQYKGIKGKLGKIRDWTYSKTLGGQRFFDWLDGMKGDFKGIWVKTFVDESNKARNNELVRKFKRFGNFENKLMELGITPKDLARTLYIEDVPGQNGLHWTVDQAMSVYAGMKNDRSREAILYGNFADAGEQAELWATKVIEALDDKYKELADFIIQDYEDNFDHINSALVAAYNVGMKHEPFYTPMRKVEFAGSEYTFNPNNLEQKQNSGMDNVERGFMNKRINFEDKKQNGIELGLVNIWHSQVDVQEHTAAFAQHVKDLRKILLGKDKDHETSIRQMIKKVHGNDTWNMIKNYFNILARDDVRNANDVLDSTATWLARNMSIAYLCGNLGTMTKQLISLPRAIRYAGVANTLNAIGQFMIQGHQFLEEVYSLDPQLQDRKGDALLRAINGDPESKGSLYQSFLNIGMIPIGWFDRAASSIVFKATYDANLKNGLSQEKAIQEAQRAVLLTQPAMDIKDKPLIWSQRGYAKLVMMFTNDMAQTFGMTIYDLAAAIKNKQVPAAMYTILGLTLSAIVNKMLTSGLPENPDDFDEWADFVASAFVNQEINSIPIIGKGAITLWDAKSGYFQNTTDPFLAPFAKFIKGANGLWDDRVDNDERAIYDLIEAGSLLAPFPSTAYHFLQYSFLFHAGNYL